MPFLTLLPFLSSINSLWMVVHKRSDLSEARQPPYFSKAARQEGNLPRRRGCEMIVQPKTDCFTEPCTCRQLISSVINEVSNGLCLLSSFSSRGFSVTAHVCNTALEEGNLAYGSSQHCCLN